jgi:meiotically up-regulated gene 157 (Mug157) protein
MLHALQIWQTEQRHESKSPYRFVELGNAGLGAPVAYTGEANLHMTCVQYTYASCCCCFCCCCCWWWW